MRQIASSNSKYYNIIKKNWTFWASLSYLIINTHNFKQDIWTLQVRHSFLHWHFLNLKYINFKLSNIRVVSRTKFRTFSKCDKPLFLSTSSSRWFKLKINKYILKINKYQLELLGSILKYKEYKTNESKFMKWRAIKKIKVSRILTSTD